MKITASFFPTKSDYISFADCAAHVKVDKTKKLIAYIIGVGIMIAGAVLAFLLNGGFFLLFTAGGFILLYFPVFYPLIVKNSAMRYYDRHSEKMISLSFVFEEDVFSVMSDRYELKNVPYRMIEKTAENSDVFIIFLGYGEYKYFPKRVLNSDEAECVKKRFNN